MGESSHDFHSLICLSGTAHRSATAITPCLIYSLIYEDAADLSKGRQV